MVTEYDVFAELMEKKTKIAQLAENLNLNYANIYAKIELLRNEKLIIKEENYYSINIHNNKAVLLVKIIDYCSFHNLNCNFFMSKKMSAILEVCLSKEPLSIDDFGQFNKTTLKKYLDRLIQYNFIIIKTRKPFTFSILKEHFFTDIICFFGGEVKLKERLPEDDLVEKIEKELKKYKQKSKKQSKYYIKNIEEELKFDFIHSTTYLEGNTLTLEETIKLLKHNIQPKKDFDDLLEVKNMNVAIDYLFENLKKPLTLDWILNLHRIIMQGLHEYNGRLRNGQVRILGNPDFKVCDYRILMPVLEEFIVNFNKKFKKCKTQKDSLILSGWVHNEFQCIHPFFDGNSRTTRILMNYCLLNFEFPLINIYEVSKDEYLSLTKLSKKRDDRKFNAFLNRIILDNLIKLNELL